MRSSFALAVFFALAGRGTTPPFCLIVKLKLMDTVAMALNIVFGGALGNLTASQVLAIPDGQLKTDVSSYGSQQYAKTKIDISVNNLAIQQPKLSKCVPIFLWHFPN